MAPSRVSPPPTSPSGLTESQLSRFHRDGYLTIPSFLTPTQCHTLLAEAHTLLSSFDLATHPKTVFSTGGGHGHGRGSTEEGGDRNETPPSKKKAHVGDDYFLTSGDKVRFFFEEDAFSPEGDGRLTKPKPLAINKIGHSLHTLLQPFADVSHLDPRVRAVSSDLGFRDPRLLQSMVICKQPEIGGAVPPHQDSTFLYTDPPSAVGFWIPLVDATAENGALSFARGSHRREPVTSRFVRRPRGEGGTTFEEVTGARFPRDMATETEIDVGRERRSDSSEKEEEYIYTLEEVQAGTLVLIHGNVLHKSEKNTSREGRMAYTFHVIEGDSETGGCVYDGKNWLQVPEDARGGSGRFTSLKG